MPSRAAIRAFGTPSAASLLISAQSSKVITLQSSSAHFSPPKVFNFRGPPTRSLTTLSMPPRFPRDRPGKDASLSGTESFVASRTGPAVAYHRPSLDVTLPRGAAAQVAWEVDDAEITSLAMVMADSGISSLGMW
jgi:hypothetical protein